MLTFVCITVTNITQLTHITYNSLLCVVCVDNIKHRCRAILTILFNFWDLGKLNALTLTVTEDDTSSFVSEFETSKWRLKIKFVTSFTVYTTVKLNAGRVGQLSPLLLPQISLSFHLDFVHFRTTYNSVTD
jgi:hypothetical protein